MAFEFENLKVCQEEIELRRLFSDVSETFPPHELYVTKRRKIISEKDFQFIYNGFDNLLIRIQALRKSIK